MNINDYLKQIYLPPKSSHKGQNGKLMVIGGSKLFHSASLWALKTASRIVDLVHYASIAENNKIVHELKKEFRDGIVIPRKDIPEYIEEDDCILIGPGMTRDEETKILTNSLLKRYPKKQWVIDAGALQMLDLIYLPKNSILTPHKNELTLLLNKDKKLQVFQDQKINLRKQAVLLAQKYSCNLLLKGEVDIAIPREGRELVIKGGNPGMTKGGTGDVLAGLIAGLACKNDAFTAMCMGSLINKQAGDDLYKKVGPFFNASDLCEQIPKTMKRVLMINK